MKKLKNYPLYPITEISTLKELIYFDTPKSNDKTAFMYSKGKKSTVNITYGQFIHDIECFGTFLYANGIKDNHIAVLGENSYEWILTYFATALGGNVIVPIDKDLSVEEINNVLSEADCSVLVYSDTYSDVADELGASRTDITFINMRQMPKLLEIGRGLTESGSRDFLDHRVSTDDLAAIVYTSGTTGISKGVMLTHSNIASNAVAACKNVRAEGSTVCALPLHHTFPFTLGICAILLYRQPIYINKSLKNFADDMLKAQPSYMFLVPMVVETMYKKVWATAREQKKDKALKWLIKVSNFLYSIGIDIRRRLFRSVLDAFGGKLDWVSCGGAAIDEKYIKGFRSFGVNIINGYGITECSPIVASNRPEFWVDGSVGVVVYGCEVKIDDPNGDGEGEILVKGSGVMKGYYKNDAATKAAFKDGWFKTGDIGRYENGVLFITGRTKNVIVLSNGKNIYPEELELLLYRIDGIDECMVYGENGLITAEIYSRGDREAIEEKIHELNRSLPPYKQISKIKFRDSEFPKTTTKKIKRG